MKIPKKIEVCPIVDSVVELRFESSIFPNAVFGLIFNSLKKEFPHVEKLPILQLPEQLRDQDPNFKYKAHYRISSGDGYAVQIGPDVIVIGSPIPYPGWTQYSKKINYVIDCVLNSGTVDKVTRLGLRFINFFEIDIFKEIDLAIAIKDQTHTPKNTLVRTEIEKQNFHNTVQISNNATRTIDNAKETGSIIDIDTFKAYENGDFNDIYQDEIELAHVTEKEIFFNLLKSDFLKSLKPTYDD